MKIGLIRHFKVAKEKPSSYMLTGAELTEWLEQYDQAEIEISEVDMGTTKWQKCFCSDMERAIETANVIYNGDLIINEKLKKIPLPRYAQVWKGKLPIIIWGIITKFILNSKHKSVVESTKETDNRAVLVMNDIEAAAAGVDILIVSHATFMMRLRKEILRRGFKGPGFKPYPINGKIYVYEK
ncbi:phosphoglycerate mutase family protein [Paenibacillus amylolyticus]|uniref:phosphoglycerate mutase family protein n=1 Tax=Paenibacillus amylolyticus TaxID=1451 RepID=UPI003D95F2EB